MFSNYRNNNPYYYGQNNIGSYYSNNYMNSYNSFLQRKREMEERNRIIENHNNIMKRFYESSLRYQGYSDDEIQNQVNKKYSQNTIYGAYQNCDSDEVTMAKIQYIEDNIREKESTRMIDRQNNIINKSKDKYPDNMGMMEFFNVATDMYFDIRMEEQREKERQLDRLYNKNDFRTLLSRNIDNDTFKGITRINGIDAFDVQLPDKLKSIATDYKNRKKYFLDSLMK